MHELSGLLIMGTIPSTCLVTFGWFVIEAEISARLAGIESVIFLMQILWDKERGAVDAVYQKWN